ncbi:MAG: hypothetical protein AB7J13_08615 [Pyrinomonadaceae bacterium]
MGSWPQFCSWERSIQFLLSEKVATEIRAVRRQSVPTEVHGTTSIAGGALYEEIAMTASGRQLCDSESRGGSRNARFASSASVRRSYLPKNGRIVGKQSATTAVAAVATGEMTGGLIGPRGIVSSDRRRIATGPVAGLGTISVGPAATADLTIVIARGRSFATEITEITDDRSVTSGTVRESSDIRP